MNAVHPLRDPWARAPVLRAHLEPIWANLHEEAVSEIAINRPGELFIERLGATEMERIVKRDITPGWIRMIATGVASATNQVINEEKPVLSGTLPSGERIQCILPPAAPDGGAISIRKQVIMDMSLDDYRNLGAFENTVMGSGLALSSEEKRLVDMLHDTSPMDFLQYAVRNRVSIVVSGGTSTGKTTFLNALLKAVPSHERIITIEDTRELRPPVPNSLTLIASKGDQGLAKVTAQQLGETSDVQKDETRTKATLFDTYYTRSVHRKEVRRPLMRPDEIRTLDKNKLIILPRGQLPILGTRNFYFADGQLAKRAFMPLPSTVGGSRTKGTPDDPPAVIPSFSLPTMAPTAPAYRSGLLQTRLQRGATFAAKSGRTASPPPRRRLVAKEPSKSTADPALPSPPAVDFSALAAKAATTRILPEKEAAIAAILGKVRSLRSYATDTEAFDRNLSVVEDILPDALDG